MEKRTLLAVVLSMAVMLGFFIIQEQFFPPAPPPAPALPDQRDWRADEPARPFVPRPLDDGQITQITGEPAFPQRVTVETDVLRVVLCNAGANIVSFQLLRHLDRGEPVEMIFTGDAPPQAFAVAFGPWEDLVANRIQPVSEYFHVRRISDLIVEFSQDFTTPAGTFNMIKRYDFRRGEYMFELTVLLNGGTSKQAFNFGGAAYTIMFGPQIGPRFARLDNRAEFRNYHTFRGMERGRNRFRRERVNEREPTLVTTNPDWAAIEGKYFTLIAIPYLNQFDLVFSALPEPGLPAASRLYITRPAVASSRVEDVFHFYLGPKNLADLIRYERGDNSFALRNTGLMEVAHSRGFLAPLERVLKFFLQLFHSWIPNYGVAIILLTILVKIVTFPLTKKGSESTIRMQALAPKIKEIQEKNKGNPQKMQAEMAAFYKKEGYNPLAGCLPMLIQFPIFIAMFGLFNNHFDLRGAEFIPGWIPDLSVPEYIFAFPEGIVIPLLGWEAIRALPFIYVGSQLLYGKVVQTPDQAANKHMKMMLFLMPIIFFFVLYNMPSGLLVYWTMSNLLTMGQQVGLNKYMARKKARAAMSSNEPPKPDKPEKPIIAPGGSKKKKRK